jgi:hypothetical protein
MNRKELAPGIMVYSDVVKDYKKLIPEIEKGLILAKRRWTPAIISDGNQNKKIRDTESLGIKYFNETDDVFLNEKDMFNKKLSSLFYKYLNPLEKDYMLFYNVDFVEHEMYDILKYGKGQKFINHIDDYSEKTRRISTVLYLNDDYLGGEILFPRFNISYKPKANDFILFPSTYVYNHSVLEVTQGKRYAVVSWIK